MCIIVGYVQLDSAVMEGSCLEAMDTSERVMDTPSQQISPQQSVFATTWSECTRSWEILNNNLQNLAAGSTSTNHVRELSTFSQSGTVQRQGEELVSLFSMVPPPLISSRQEEYRRHGGDDGLSVES